MTVRPVSPTFRLGVYAQHGHAEPQPAGEIEVVLLANYPPCGHHRCRELFAVISLTIRLSREEGLIRALRIPLDPPKEY